MNNPEEIERIKRCIAFLEAHPSYPFPLGWQAGVEQEAEAAGLIEGRPPVIGCNCPTEPYFEPPYGGDSPDLC